MEKTNGTSNKRKNLITILWDKPKRDASWDQGHWNEESWMRKQQTCRALFTIHFNMWTVSSDVMHAPTMWMMWHVKVLYTNNIIIKSKTEKSCLSIHITIPTERNTSIKVTKKLLKYKDLEIEIEWMWEMKAKRITEILGAHPTTRHQNTKTTENHSMSASHILRTQGCNYGKN